MQTWKSVYVLPSPSQLSTKSSILPAMHEVVSHCIPDCPHCRADAGLVSRAGKFWRQDDSRLIQRFLCKSCDKNFSAATGKDTYRQKNRRINEKVRRLLVHKVTLRGIGRILRIDRKTATHRLDFFGLRSRRYFDGLRVRDLRHIQFDELQSSIHSKCKPVSIPLAVDAETRFILALNVVSMPAQHPLTEIAMRRYGPRADDRAAGIGQVLRTVRPMLAHGGQVTTDSAPRYPAPILRLLPDISHIRVKGRKPCATGQGELKKTGFDPLFPLNHTAAMIRDGVSRMVRKTWGNSKRMDRLESHLLVYAHAHNTERLKKLPRLE